MKKPQFLPPIYAPDGPQEINRAQREDRPKPHQIKANASKQTLLEELAEIDAVYAEGEVTAEYEKRGAEIKSRWRIVAAPELLAGCTISSGNMRQAGQHSFYCKRG